MPPGSAQKRSTQVGIPGQAGLQLLEQILGQACRLHLALIRLRQFFGREVYRQARVKNLVEFREKFFGKRKGVIEEMHTETDSLK